MLAPTTQDAVLELFMSGVRAYGRATQRQVIASVMHGEESAAHAAAEADVARREADLRKAIQYALRRVA